MLGAVKQNGKEDDALEHAAGKHQTDHAIVLEAVKQNRRAEREDVEVAPRESYRQGCAPPTIS